MQSYSNWAQLGDQTVSVPGSSPSTTLVQRSYPLATVSVYDSGTSNLSTIYSDNSSTPLANPFTANANGSFIFFAANGTYDVVLSGAGIASPFTIQSILLNDTGGAGITSINALTDPAELLVTGTAGTDFAIVSSVDTHTFNLPTASASNRGALAAADFTTFNAKQAAISVTAPIALSGSTISLNTVPIASGGTANTTATTAFNALAPTTTKGDIIAHNGTNNIRLGVGTDGYALVAASAQPTGLNYVPVPTVPVTVPNGGTGLTTLTGVPYGTGTAALTPVVASSQLQYLRRTPNVVGTTYSFGPVPYVVSSDFDFPAQTPGGTLSSGVGATVTLTPVPLGVNGADTGHYLYITGGTGAAEAVLITGGTATSGASSGTVIFTPANSHSGAWTIVSATQGIQEAISYLPSGITQVWVPAGTITLNADLSYAGKTNAAIVFNPGTVLAGTGIVPVSASGLNYLQDERTKPCLFTQTATVTVANTGTETTLIGAGVGSITLPANFFTIGRVLKVKAWGVHGATGGPTIDLKIKVGGSTVLDTTAVTSNNDTNKAWQLEGWITCRTIGGTGTIIGQGRYEEISHAAFGMANTATTTIDTTAALAIAITVQFGTADPANTISATNLTLEAIQ